MNASARSATVLKILLALPGLAACDGADEGSTAVESLATPLRAATPCGATLAPHFSWAAADKPVLFRLVVHHPGSSPTRPGDVVVTPPTKFDRYTPSRWELRCSGVPMGCSPSRRIPATLSGPVTITTLKGFACTGSCTTTSTGTVAVDDQGKLTVTTGATSVEVSNVECLDGNVYGVGDKAAHSISLVDVAPLI
jgi:hypothetical protein